MVAVHKGWGMTMGRVVCGTLSTVRSLDLADITCMRCLQSIKIDAIRFLNEKRNEMEIAQHEADIVYLRMHDLIRARARDKAITRWRRS